MMSPPADPLYRAAARVLDVPAETLSDESSPKQIHSWDSLNHLNLILELEAEFGVRLSAEAALRIRTLGLARTVLREHGVDI
jgi:acyl carrier protein